MIYSQGTFPEAGRGGCDEGGREHDFLPCPISLEDVRNNFSQFELLTDNVIFKRDGLQPHCPL